jgi:Xaa-Pro aminopeptidase
VREPAAAPPRGFPDAEFASRVACAQALMGEQDLTALLLTTEPEVRYFSGFLTPFWQSPARPWFLVVPAEGKPVAVIPSIGAAAMAGTWIDDIRTWSSPAPMDEGISVLAATLHDVTGGRGLIGLPMGPETHLRMPLCDFEVLKAALDKHAFVDATDVVRRLRMVKSTAEIAKIAYLCAVVSGVFESLPALLHGGMTEAEVFRTFKRACLTAGADDVPYLVGGAGAGGYGDIISPPSERALARGDVLVLDAGVVHDGYWSDFDRNYAVGPLDAAAEEAHATLYAATEAGIAAVRPGVTAADVFATMQRVIAPGAGASGDVGRFGHGVGMQLTEWPSFAAFDDTVLQPGMVLTLEPSLSFGDGKMMVHEEVVVVRETGAELLTRRAREAMAVIPDH